MNTDLIGTWRTEDWGAPDKVSFMHIRRDRISDLVFVENAGAEDFFGISVLTIDHSSDHSFEVSQGSSYSFEVLTRQLSRDEFMFYRMDGKPGPRMYFAARIEFSDLPESMMKYLVYHRHYPTIFVA